MADPVNFTRPAAERIARVVRAVEGGNRDGTGPTFDRPWYGGGGGGRLQLGTFTGAWQTGQYTTVTLHGVTQTASVYNWCNPTFGGGSETAGRGYVVFGSAGGRKSAVELPLSSVRLGKTTSPWLFNTEAPIELWGSGDPPEESPSSEGLTAWNKSYDVAACVWVLVAQAQNGHWYLIEAATPDPSESGCKAPNIGGHDLTTVSGYVSNKKQALTHDENACLKWVDIEDCA